MERKYLFLNNDISAMLSHEERIKLKMTPEADDELNTIRQEAECIIQNPTENIDAECIIKRSIRYSATDEYFLTLFLEGKDLEQLSNLQTIEHVATMTLLPEAIFPRIIKFNLFISVNNVISIFISLALYGFLIDLHKLSAKE